MSIILSGGLILAGNQKKRVDILIDNGNIVSVDSLINTSGCEIIDCSNKYIFPGFVDVHVHFREPGFSYKETIKTGSAAAAHGGYTSVCTMPNLLPCPDSAENLAVQSNIIKKDALINVYPYGTITKGEAGEVLSDMDALAPDVIAFSDDGRGVQNSEMMLLAMQKAEKLGKIIAAHCEVNELLNGGYIHNGIYAAEHGHRGISSESEWKQIERDIVLCRQTGCAYHVCHISTAESVELIRQAKAAGINVTCETGPHYLVLNDLCLQEDGKFKMNPPIRSEHDREALILGIQDGTIDMIATDHAPHSAEEKSRGLDKSLMGIVGLETAFPVLYTELVRNNVITLDKLISLMSTSPAKRFGLKSGIEPGMPADLCIFDLDKKFTIDPDKFLSKGRATPFADKEVYGKCVMTICGGSIVYKES